MRSHALLPRCSAFLTLLLLSFVFVSSSSAQNTTAALKGTVSDPSGAVIPGVTVTITNTATGLSDTVASDASGFFSFPVIAVGAYQLRVSSTGFSQYTQTGLVLDVGQTGVANVALKPGDGGTQVEVNSNVPLVDTETPTSNQVIQGQQTVDLPLNGRNSQDLVNLAAGTVNLARYVTPVNGQGGLYPDEATFAVNGAFRETVNYQMDGVDHNDTYLNTNLPFPNPDSIHEFALQSANFSAEYGNAAGGIVNIVTKSGSNSFHGSAFEFLRNGSMNAKNYFATGHDTLHRNQFGGSIGGPILKNKFFFFGTYQGTKVSQAANTVTTYVPTAQERTGNFSDYAYPLKNPVTGAALVGNQIPLAC